MPHANREDKEEGNFDWKKCQIYDSDDELQRASIEPTPILSASELSWTIQLEEIPLRESVLSQSPLKKLTVLICDKRVNGMPGNFPKERVTYSFALKAFHWKRF